jgi:hypothetical protein
MEISAQATESSALSTGLGRRGAVLLRETEHYGETHCNEVNLLCPLPFSMDVTVLHRGYAQNDTHI